MANPQVKDGFTRIANEVLEALAKLRIPGEANQVLLFIARKTWGYQKKVDSIPLSQFCVATGISKAHIIRAVSTLQKMNLIFIAKEGNGKVSKYRINKDFDTWKPLPKKGTLPRMAMSVAKEGNESLPKKGPSKETTKETYSKEICDTPPSEGRHGVPKRETDSRITRIREYYRMHFNELFNQTPNIHNGKDSKLLKSLFATLDKDFPDREEAEAEMERLIDRFLTSEDPFIKNTGRTIGVFQSCFQQIRRPKKKGKYEGLVQ